MEKSKSTPMPRRPWESEDREIDYRFRRNTIFILTATGVKVAAVIFSIVILTVIQPFRPDYNLSIIIGTCSCTIFYTAVSVLTDLGIFFKCHRITSQCDFIQMIATVMLLCCWMLSTGISISVSLSSGATTTEQFGWIGACSGLSFGLFIALVLMYSYKTVLFVFKRSDE